MGASFVILGPGLTRAVKTRAAPSPLVHCNAHVAGYGSGLTLNPNRQVAIEDKISTGIGMAKQILNSSVLQARR
jgi:hypothetical protein